MPVKLDTPIQPTASYAEVQITDTRTSHKDGRERIVLMLEYGETVDGEWVPAQPQPTGLPTTHTIDGDDLVTFLTTHAALYDAVKAAYYQEMIDRGVLPSGTVE